MMDGGLGDVTDMYIKRFIHKHNSLQNHQYIKRGMSCTVSNYMIGGWPGGAQSAYVTIYSSDGSVAVAISGVEFVQGLFTKVRNTI